MHHPLYQVIAECISPDRRGYSYEGEGKIIGETCHIFNFFDFIVYLADVVEVCAQTVGLDSEHIHSSENASVSVRYRDGSVCTLIYTSLGAKELPKEYVEIYADGKVLVIDDYKELRVYGAKVKGWKSTAQDKGHLEELKTFAKLVKGETDISPIPLEELITATKVSFLAVERGVS